MAFTACLHSIVLLRYWRAQGEHQLWDPQGMGAAINAESPGSRHGCLYETRREGEEQDIDRAVR